MRKTFSLVAVLVVVTGAALFGVTGPAAAVPLMRLHSAQYDAPGPDDRTDGHRNQEWISLVNTGPRSIQLRGWTIRDKAGQVFRFGTTTIAANGGRVFLFTGPGTPTPGHRFWKSEDYVWDNTGDTVWLRNPDGGLHDTCTWGPKTDRTTVAC